MRGATERANKGSIMLPKMNRHDNMTLTRGYSLCGPFFSTAQESVSLLLGLLYIQITNFILLLFWPQGL